MTDGPTWFYGKKAHGKNLSAKLFDRVATSDNFLLQLRRREVASFIFKALV